MPKENKNSFLNENVINAMKMKQLVFRKNKQKAAITVILIKNLFHKTKIFKVRNKTT